jgi:energy-coupling factor transport system ATP-binding protein
MMRFDDIAFSYGGTGGRRALEGVSFEVEPGEIVAVLGANGSGKSTLARLSNGILLPERGSVTVGGVDTRDAARLREVRELLAIVFQHPDDQIVATTVEDDVAFGPENLGLARGEIRERVDEALQAVGLAGLERREPHTLSGGQKQRLAIAGALAMRPTFMVLDEPASMLDPSGRTDVLRIIDELRGSGRGIVHITHDLSDVMSADRTVVLDEGRPSFVGPLDELMGSPALLESCGLEVPPIARLATALVALGVPTPFGSPTPESIVGALWA